MWDCLVLIIEKFMLKSQGISHIFLSGVPPFLVLFLSTDCQKSYIAPKLACQIFGLPLGRPLLMQGNFGFLGDIGWSLPKYHSHDTQYLWDYLVPLKVKFQLGP